MGAPKLQSDSDALLQFAKNIGLMYMRRSGNDYVQSKGTDFINNVAFAMHLRPKDTMLKEGERGDVVFFSQDVLDGIQHVIDAIRDYGSDEPHMVIYPLVLDIEETNELFDNVATLPLFKVRNKDDVNEFRFIDITGRSYKDKEDFVGGAQFPQCKMYYPKDLKFTEDEDHFPELTLTSITPSIMKYADIAITVLCIGAGILTIFFGIGAPALVACSTYGIIRAGVTLIDRALHAQTIDPFEDWDAFNAWAGIVANAVGLGMGAKAFQISGTMARMAQEGAEISTTMELGRRVSIAIPMFLNLGIMGAQAYQLYTFWDKISITDKIIIFLQYFFFAAGSVKMTHLSLKGFETQLFEVAYKELVAKLQTIYEDPTYAATVKDSLNTAIKRIGGFSYEAIHFLKKIVNYNNGELINTSTNPSSAQYLELTKRGTEVMFKMRESYLVCPEAVMDINDSIKIAESEPQPSSSQDTGYANRLRIVSELARKRRFISEESVTSGQKWLKNALKVDNLESYKAKNINIFKNMKYSDQIRTRVFEEIGMGLNDGLVKACFKYAVENIPEDAKERNIGQFASDFEVAALLIQKEANSFSERVTKLKMTPDMVKNKLGVDMKPTHTKTLSYADLPNEKGSNLFAAEKSAKVMRKEYQLAITKIGKEDATVIYNIWENSCIIEEKFIVNTEKDVHALANQIIEAGEIYYPNARNQAINAAFFFANYPEEPIETFAIKIASEANETIQSCKNDIISRVFEITKPNEKLPIRRLLFWNLNDGEYAKSTMVNLNTATNKVTIQNISLTKMTQTRTALKSARNAVMDHWNTDFDYDSFKADFDQLVSSMWQKCKEFVGPSVIRAGGTHDQTVFDIQELYKLRFSTIEQAVCHVIKHGENVTKENLSTAIADYCNKAKDIINYSKQHPENVSSSWTQTGSARDFVFYRKLPEQKNIDKVVVLVREGGETILKTCFTDENLTSIPEQTKHAFREPLDLRHVSMTTFYYQLMVVAPRYGVLLPKDYDLYESDMESTKTRTILIMAGHFFGKDEIPALTDFAKALNQAFPTDGVFWNALATKDKYDYSFSVYGHEDNYMYFRIKSYRFIVFQGPTSVENGITMNPALIANNHTNKRKRRSIEQKHGFNDSDALNAAVQLISRTNKATEITRKLKELFGEYWHCIRAPKFHYCIYYHNAFLKMTLDDGYITCAIFR